MIDAAFRKSLGGLISPATAKTYERDLSYFWAWAKDTFGATRRSYPIRVEWLIAYIKEHSYGVPAARVARLSKMGHMVKRSTLSCATLKRHIVPISVEHILREVANPCRHPTFVFLMKRLSRKQNSSRQALAPITADTLYRLLSTCGDDLRGIRDRAILLVGFSGGGRRRSELAALSVEHLEKVEDGYIARLPTHKTVRFTQRMLVFPIFNKAAEALDRWLQVANIQSGRVFRGISYYGGILKKMEPAVVSYVVRYRAEAAGLNRHRFNSMSLRAGFMSEAAHQGISLLEAMAVSGHRKVDSAMRYYRSGDLRKNPAAHLSQRL